MVLQTQMVRVLLTVYGGVVWGGAARGGTEPCRFQYISPAMMLNKKMAEDK
jgi:hypothetical protein